MNAQNPSIVKMILNGIPPESIGAAGEPAAAPKTYTIVPFVKTVTAVITAVRLDTNEARMIQTSRIFGANFPMIGMRKAKNSGTAISSAGILSRSMFIP